MQKHNLGSFDNFCAMISTGLGNRSEKIQLPELSNHLRTKYNRLTINASYGCWRKSDVWHLSLDQFNSDGIPQHTSLRISNIVRGFQRANRTLKQSMHVQNWRSK